MLKRRELKYYCSFEIIEDLRQRILNYMDYDPYCLKQPDKTYSVRSIYLDTSDLLFYYEKLDGVKIRKKLRVRTYNSLENSEEAFLEIKRKIKNNVFKERVLVAYDDTPNLANGANIRLINQQPEFTEKSALTKFVYLAKALKLEPKVLITYEREAFIGREDPSQRVTFDINVRSYPQPGYEDRVVDEDCDFLTGDKFILEVKFNDRMPVWIKNIIRDFCLNVQSISKYCNGLDIWLARKNVEELS